MKIESDMNAVTRLKRQQSALHLVSIGIKLNSMGYEAKTGAEPYPRCAGELSRDSELYWVICFTVVS